jgi:hypothetical protein
MNGCIVKIKLLSKIQCATSVNGQDDASMTSSSSTPAMEKKQTLPMSTETTALLVVDVQPEYWTNCPAARQDFPEFPSRLASTIETCQQRNTKIIWVRADYRYSRSPWLIQFERIHKGSDIPALLPCDPIKECKWENGKTLPRRLVREYHPYNHRQKQVIRPRRILP